MRVTMDLSVRELRNSELAELAAEVAAEQRFRGEPTVGLLGDHQLTQLTTEVARELRARGILHPDLAPLPPPPPPFELDDAEKALVETGRMIPAIKHMRDRLKNGLKEAKDACDAYRNLQKVRQVPL